MLLPYALSIIIVPYSLMFHFHVIYGQGNTAVYLLYAHARICSIIRKSGKDIEVLKKVGLVLQISLFTLLF